MLGARSAGGPVAHCLHGGLLVQLLLSFGVGRLEVEDHLLHGARELNVQGALSL